MTTTTNHKTILKFFVKLQTTIRLFHWTTKSYSKHVAADIAYGKLDDLIDDFVESYLAHFKMSTNIIMSKISMNCRVYNDKAMLNYLIRKRDDLSAMDFKFNDLSSIRDEMITVLSKTIYLFDTQ